MAGSPLGVGVIVNIHGPELIAPKGLTQKSHSFLLEEHRAFGIQPDEHDEDGHQPGKDGQHDDQGGHDVHYSLVNQIIIIVGAMFAYKLPVTFLPVFQTMNGPFNDCALHVTKDWFFST
jgi:hypothetical protein